MNSFLKRTCHGSLRIEIFKTILWTLTYSFYPPESCTRQGFYKSIHCKHVIQQHLFFLFYYTKISKIPWNAKYAKSPGISLFQVSCDLFFLVMLYIWPICTNACNNKRCGLIDFYCDSLGFTLTLSRMWNIFLFLFIKTSQATRTLMRLVLIWWCEIDHYNIFQTFTTW